MQMTAAEKLVYIKGAMNSLQGSAMPPEQAFKRMTQLFGMVVDAATTLEKENDSIRREISMLWTRLTDLEDYNGSSDSST